MLKNNNYRTPKTKSGMKTFLKIINTSKKLFGEHGYLGTSINDIISQSHVAAGTFYIYFDNKLSVYLFLLNEYSTGIRKASSLATANLKTRYEIEREGLKAFIKYVWNDPLAYKIVWESLFVDNELFKEYYKTFSASYIHHLQKFVDNGEIRNDIDLETVSYVLMGIANFVGLQVLFKESLKPNELNKIVDDAMKILNEGIFNKKS